MRLIEKACTDCNIVCRVESHQDVFIPYIQMCQQITRTLRVTCHMHVVCTLDHSFDAEAHISEGVFPLSSQQTVWIDFLAPLVGMSGITSDPNNVWPDFETHTNIKWLWRLTVWKMCLDIWAAEPNFTGCFTLSPYKPQELNRCRNDDFIPWRTAFCKSKWIDNYCSETKRQTCCHWVSVHLHFSASDVSVYQLFHHLFCYYYSLPELPTVCVSWLTLEMDNCAPMATLNTKHWMNRESILDLGVLFSCFTTSSQDFSRGFQLLPMVIF